MLVGNVVLTENAGAARVHRTPGETAAYHTWLDQYAEEMRRLDEIEPLPDNFEAICEGRETVPLYSR
jgi:hypothetical protein